MFLPIFNRAILTCYITAKTPAISYSFLSLLLTELYLLPISPQKHLRSAAHISPSAELYLQPKLPQKHLQSATPVSPYRRQNYTYSLNHHKDTCSQLLPSLPIVDRAILTSYITTKTPIVSYFLLSLSSAELYLLPISSQRHSRLATPVLPIVGKAILTSYIITKTPTVSYSLLSLSSTELYLPTISPQRHLQLATPFSPYHRLYLHPKSPQRHLRSATPFSPYRWQSYTYFLYHHEDTRSQPLPSLPIVGRAILTSYITIKTPAVSYSLLSLSSAELYLHTKLPQRHS